MTKAQKSAWKSLDDKPAKRDFLDMLVKQQVILGGRFKAWPIAYARRCDKRGVKNPLDKGGKQAV